MPKIMVHHDQCLFLAILSPTAQKLSFMLRLWFFTKEYLLVHQGAKKRASISGTENRHIVTLCVSRYCCSLGIRHPEVYGKFWCGEVIRGRGNLIGSLIGCSIPSDILVAQGNAYLQGTYI